MRRPWKEGQTQPPYWGVWFPEQSQGNLSPQCCYQLSQPWRWREPWEQHGLQWREGLCRRMIVGALGWKQQRWRLWWLQKLQIEKKLLERNCCFSLQNQENFIIKPEGSVRSDRRRILLFFNQILPQETGPSLSTKIITERACLLPLLTKFCLPALVMPLKKYLHAPTKNSWKNYKYLFISHCEMFFQFEYSPAYQETNLIIQYG